MSKKVIDVRDSFFDSVYELASKDKNIIFLHFFLPYFHRKPIITEKVNKLFNTKLKYTCNQLLKMLVPS